MDDKAHRASGRRRKIAKKVFFSEAEWQAIEARLASAPWRSFSDYARLVLTQEDPVAFVYDDSVEAEPRRVEADPLVQEIRRIGNNVNQIARRVNSQDFATYDQVTAAHQLLRRLWEQVKRGDC